MRLFLRRSLAIDVRRTFRSLFFGVLGIVSLLAAVSTAAIESPSTETDTGGTGAKGTTATDSTAAGDKKPATTSTTTAAATASASSAYTPLVTCHTPTAPATGSQPATTQEACSGLSLSGDTPATIFIDGLPLSDSQTIDLQMIPNKLRKAPKVTGEWSYKPGKSALQVTVYTSRAFWKTFNAQDLECSKGNDGGSTKCPLTVVFGPVPAGLLITVYSEKQEPDPNNPKVNLTKKTEYDFEIPLKFNPWATVDFGGFYAYSWAHDDMLVTQDAGNGMTKVLERRRGDRVGPNQGIVASFRSTNYPYLGIEFGTADVTGHGSSYFFGPSLRLLGEDKALFSIGTGISVAKILRYPQAQVGAAYPTDDKRLTSTAMNSHKPYVSISLAVSLSKK